MGFNTNLATKIGELKLDPSDDGFKEQVDFKVTQGRCWHVVFAPDESCFAWICAPKKVLIVPWNREKNCLETSSIKSGLPVSQSGPVQENKRAPITLSCSHPFLCVAFGLPSSALSTWETSNTVERSAGLVPVEGVKRSWIRFDFSKVPILASGHSNGRIRIWNVDTGEFLMELLGHKSAVRDVAFASDGSLRLVSASLDKTLKGWDLTEDGSVFKTFIAHKEAALWCSWSPNSRIMASAGNEKTVFIWDMQRDYKLKRTLEGHCHNVVSCSFSPDGAVLATASWDSQVILWDPHIGTILYTLYHLHPPPSMMYASGANGAWVRGVSYAKDGMHIVSVAEDHLIRFWNLMGDMDPEGIAVEDEDALSCSYSPSGRCVAVGTDKFKVSFYTTPAEVPRLTHISRMAIRKLVLPQDLDKLDIPLSLNKYLKYEMWT